VRERAAIVPAAHGCTSLAELKARGALLAAGASPLPDDAPLEAVLGAVDVRDALRGAAAGYGLAIGAAGGDEKGGRIGDAAALGAIGERLRRGTAQFGEDVAWATSVSALETYAACPFKYFAARVLSLPEPDAAEDDLDAREGGTLLHDVVADVFSALRDQGLLPLEGGPRAEREQAVALAATGGALDRWERKERTGPPPLWQLRREHVGRAVVRLLESEVRRASHLVPSEFEAAFGDEDAPALFLPAPEGPERIAVRGRIDRVDRTPDGDEVEVIDYKSGGVEGRVDGAEFGRSSFQLPIYAAWARQQSGATRVDASLRSLKDGASSRTLLAACEKAEVPLEPLLELDPERRRIARNAEAVLPAAGAGDLPDDGDPNLADAAWSFLLAMREGRFDVAPYGGAGPKKGCMYCRFKTVCRVGGGA
jgi:RecB family exonuclease